MKKKIVFLSLCLLSLVTTTSGQLGVKIPPPPSHTIKEAEDKIVVIDQDIATKQAAIAVLQPKLEKAQTIWGNYHAAHADSPASQQTIATCDSYYITYEELYKQSTALSTAITDLERQKKDQQDLIEIKKQEFLNEMVGKSLCAGNLSISSSYDELMACWRCFFDGSCGEYGPTPEKGKGFVIVPNGPKQGAPPVFTPLSEEYKNRYNPDYRDVPKPKITPPQKGYIEQATDKVRQIFNDVIKKMQGVKVRRVAVPVAVRG
jgi:hypothetical protein